MQHSRRHFLRSASAAGAFGSIAMSGCAHRVAGVAGLAAPGAGLTIAQAGRRSGILAGAAVSVRALRQSAEYAQLIRLQCGIVVAENEMKFAPLRPGPETFFFDDADFLVKFAEKNNILVRGHNFMWHRQLPAWFNSYVTPANAEQLLVSHIEQVAGRYKGRIESWDVANEVIQLDDHQPGGMRDAPWFRLLGMGGLDLAYRTARRVDPHALLCYNDYGIESEAPEQAAKRAAVLALLRGMQQRGVPIDGVGIQGHIAAGPSHRYGPGLTRFMADVRAMGLKLLVTELDVNDRDLPADHASRDREVAAVYKDFLQLTLSHEDVIALLTWGLTDKYTWLNGEDSRADHLPERCLPFDAMLQPVPAYGAEVQALLQAPVRPVVRGRAGAL